MGRCLDLEPAQNEETCETCGGTGHLTPRETSRLMAGHLVKADRWANRRLSPR